MAIMTGNLAPQGAIVKVAGIPTQLQRFVGPARVFECEEEAFAAVQKREYKAGEVLVIRNEGPKGGPGMREMLATTASISGQGMGKKVALITAGRFSGGSAWAMWAPNPPWRGQSACWTMATSSPSTPSPGSYRWT